MITNIQNTGFAVYIYPKSIFWESGIKKVSIIGNSNKSTEIAFDTAQTNVIFLKIPYDETLFDLSNYEQQSLTISVDGEISSSTNSVPNREFTYYFSQDLEYISKNKNILQKSPEYGVIGLHVKSDSAPIRDTTYSAGLTITITNNTGHVVRLGYISSTGGYDGTLKLANNGVQGDYWEGDIPDIKIDAASNNLILTGKTITYNGTVSTIKNIDLTTYKYLCLDIPNVELKYGNTWKAATTDNYFTIRDIKYRSITGEKSIYSASTDTVIPGGTHVSTYPNGAFDFSECLENSYIPNSDHKTAEIRIEIDLDSKV